MPNEGVLHEAVNRGEPGAALRLADLLRGEGRAADAEEFYWLAAERGEPGAMVRLGDMKRGVDNAASERAYRDALALGEKEAAVRLGDVLRVEKRLEEAEAAYRLGLESDAAEARDRLGQLLRSRGRVYEALDLYLEGLEHDEHEMTLRTAEVHEAMGNLADAERAYRSAVDRGEWEANTRLGQFYEKLDRLPDALGAYERGDLTGDPDADEHAARVRRRLASPGGRAGGSAAVLPAVASDVAGGKDLLGVGGDVSAIANLVAARGTVPPLSIGLFGDWGSGKSFFIGEVQKRVRHLASLSRGPESSPYCAHVRNISFNAWHYAEANLWASLVTHIFDELARPELPSGMESEATALEQVARLEEKLAESFALKERLQRARDHRRQIQARRKLLFWTWKLAGVTGKQSLGDVQDKASKIYRAFKLLVPNAPARRAFLALAVSGALVAFAVILLAGGPQVTQVLVTVGAAVAVPLSAFELVRKHVLRLLDQAGAVASVIDVRDTDIDTELEIASAAELELRRELTDLSAGRRLARMASEHSGDYREHLGLVSRIHDDFVQMSKLLRGEIGTERANSHTEASNGNELPQIDRIVLYIDDLDRCPPGRVMQVLEAVHLILAVPLFVVIVAVDPRWLLQSLTLHYAELLAQETPRNGRPRDEQPELGADSWGASPIDYLEKIIQVPFTLRPMDKDSAHSLVHGLLPAEATDEKPDADEKRKPPDPMRQSSDEEGRDPIEPLPRPEVVPVTPIESTPPLDTRTLVLTQAELDFAAMVAAGLRTPRTVKKFTNLYRLLRAGLDERSGALEHFLREDTGDTPEYQAVLILLAAIIAFTDDAPGFLAGLLQQPTTTGDFWVDYLRDVKPPKRGGDLLEVLNTITTTHGSDPEWTCEPFRRWALEVSRYSFTTGQEVFAHFNSPTPPPSA